MTSLDHFTPSVQHQIGDSFCKRYDQLYHVVNDMSEPLKRKITQLNHIPNANEHLFIPQHSITLGEYNLTYFLIYSNNRKAYQKKSSDKT
jgi:hypothetical protein